MEKLDYKWMLRKGSKKDICPHCGRKSFVPYVSAADRKTLAGAEFGRCERINHCGYISYPNGIEKEVAPIEVAQVKAEPITIDWLLVKLMRREYESNLYWYMVRLIDSQKAMAAAEAYHLGTTRQGGTIFWQITSAGVVRAGKVIYYKKDGHRQKDIFPPVQWVHKIKGAEPYVRGEELAQCFFGEHLLTDNEQRPVAICESEKTAMIMSQVLPQYVWLACGGATNLKNKTGRRCLQGRKVVLFPDNGQYFAWKIIASDKGWRIDDTCERHSVFEGCDILDIYEQKRNKEYEI